MKVLVIGSGGREHAIAHTLSQSSLKPELHFAPGNAGMNSLGQRLDIQADDLQSLLIQAQREQYDLTVVGPEAPLALGLVDLFTDNQLPVFGPCQAAAQLEASKAFAKELMAEAGIPTAPYHHAQTLEDALEALERFSSPYVIKEDGLAAGKGVTVTDQKAEATAAIERGFAKGGTVVLEGFLEGQELSVLALCDGERALPLVSAQDFKRVGEGNTGPNTGGMGAYAPVPFVTDTLMQTVQEQILQPVLEVMKQRGTPYKGVLYAGLMINSAGEPSVVEFNCRFGDPETQVVLPLLAVDLLPLLQASAAGDLSAYEQTPLAQSGQHAVTVVMAAKGYPGNYEKGLPLSIPDALPDGVHVFHAGTKITPDQQLVTNGGRVLNVTAFGASLTEAREKAYAAVQQIDFSEGFYRVDIAELASRDLTVCA